MIVRRFDKDTREEFRHVTLLSAAWSIASCRGVRRKSKEFEAILEDLKSGMRIQTYAFEYVPDADPPSRKSERDA